MNVFNKCNKDQYKTATACETTGTWTAGTCGSHIFHINALTCPTGSSSITQDKCTKETIQFAFSRTIKVEFEIASFKSIYSDLNPPGCYIIDDGNENIHLRWNSHPTGLSAWPSATYKEYFALPGARNYVDSKQWCLQNGGFIATILTEEKYINEADFKGNGKCNYIYVLRRCNVRWSWHMDMG